MINEPSNEGLVLNKGQIVKEGDDVIYEIQVAESVINCNTLIMLLGIKPFNVKRLHTMGKVSKESNNNHLVPERNERKKRCSVRTAIIIKEEDPFVKIKAGT
jgi:hypothetical protein